MPGTEEIIAKTKAAAIKNLQRSRPEFLQQSRPTITPRSFVDVNLFDDLGTMAVASATFAEARRWFSISRDAYVSVIEAELAKAPLGSFGEKLPHPIVAGTHLPGAIRYGCLVSRRPLQDSQYGLLAPLIPLLLAKLDQRMEEFYQWKPNLDAGPSSNSALRALVELGVIPATYFEMKNLKMVVLDHLRRLEAWHGALGASEAVLTRKHFTAHHAIPAYVALLEADSATFVKEFSGARRLRKFQTGELHRAICDSITLAIFLRAHETMGPMPLADFPGLPQGFDPEPYWKG